MIDPSSPQSDGTSYDAALRNRFALAAAAWDDNPARVAMAAAIGRAMRAVIPLTPDMRVLDFGCGTGLLSLHFADAVRHVIAADASAEMLAVLHRKLAEQGIASITTLQWDIEACPCPTEPVDAIVSSMALHHVRNTELAVARFAEALRPSGFLAITDLESEDGTFHPDPTGVYHHGFDTGRLAECARRAGFTQPNVRHVHDVVRPTADGTPRSYGVFLLTAQRS